VRTGHQHRRQRRSYDMQGRRVLEILRIGGERKHAILSAIVGGEEVFKPVVARLLRAGSIVQRRRQGGLHYAAAKASV
jgi:hypothetical protein